MCTYNYDNNKSLWGQWGLMIDWFGIPGMFAWPNNKIDLIDKVIYFITL